MTVAIVLGSLVKVHGRNIYIYLYACKTSSLLKLIGTYD